MILIKRQNRSFLLLALLVTGCSTPGPKYERPALELPASPALPGQSAPAAAAVSIDRTWWKVFGDSKLDALINDALVNNLDLAMAAARVDEARAGVDTARSQQLPRVDGLASLGAAQRQFTYGQTEREFNRRTTYAKAGVAANWEIDLWGRIREMNDASLARLAASEQGRNAVNLSVSSTIAESWFLLRSLDKKLEITRDAVVNLKAVSELEYRRWKAKAGTELAYRQSMAELTATEARIPGLEGAVAKTELALQVLAGRSPRAMTQRLGRGGELIVPVTPREVDTDLLLRRPDVASAESMLIAAHADLASIRAERYPKLTLSLLAGLLATSASAISGTPIFWDASAGLTAPLFDNGLNRSRGDAAEARRQQAVANYRYTLSVAYRDTYESLINLETSDRQYQSIEQEVASRKLALTLHEKSYSVGRSSKYEVLSETIKVLNAEMSLTDARLDQLNARARYFKSLGGGF